MSKTRRKRAARRREAMRLQERRQSHDVRDLTTRSVAVRASSLDADARTVETVLTTEAPVPVLDMRTFEVIDEVLLQRGGSFPSQLPLLDSHIAHGGLRHQLGSIRDIRVDKSDGDNHARTGTLHFGEGEHVDHAWGLVRDGHVTDVSIGYRVHEYTDINPGESRRVRGRRFDNSQGTRRLRISTRWEAREGSVVPIGADQAAKIREQLDVPAAVQTPKLEIGTMNERLRAYLVGLGMRADASDADALRFMNGLDGEERAQAQVFAETDEPGTRIETEADPPPDAGDADDGGDADAGEGAEAGRRAGVAEERARVAAIRAMAPPSATAETIDRLINSGASEGESARAFLADVQNGRSESVGSTPPAGFVREAHAGSAQTLGVALMLRCGLDPSNIVYREDLGRWVHDADRSARNGERHRANHERLMEQATRYSDITLLDLAREACRLAGVSVYGRQDVINEVTRGGSMSTAHMTTILSAVVNKALLDAYAEVTDTTDGWTRAVDVPDFKLNTRARMSKMSGLDRLPPGGTADHTTFDDVGETYAAHRYANQFVVDEQTMINDDLAAIMTIPAEMGRAAARLRPDLVYAIINANAALQQDGLALFEASVHRNLVTPGTALDIDSLGELITLMATQTQNGVNLNIRPTHLITPQQLRLTARQIVNSTTLITGQDATLGDVNPINGENLTPVADNRMSAAGVVDPLTGTLETGDDNAFMIASADNPEIEVGYVAGTGRVPTLRSTTLDRGQYGIGWDVMLDVGAKALGYRGVAYSEGGA